MATMDPAAAMEAAAREVAAVWRFLSSGLEASSAEGVAAAAVPTPRLSFSTEEEQALDDKVSDALANLERAIARAGEWAAEELRDPAQVTAAHESTKKHEALLKTHTARCRKALVTYRQRAKAERLERARQSLVDGSAVKANTEGGKATTGAGDVTAALKRTKQAMSQEIERVASVTKVLDDGRLSLQSSHAEYSGVSSELAEVRARLKALQWQAQQDRMWIGAGIAVLAATVLFIIYERTGFLVI